MAIQPDDTLTRSLIGTGAVLVLGVAHGVHDVGTGWPIVPAFLPTVAVALQVATLSLGHGMARSRGWPWRGALALGVVVSTAFGALAVSLHFWTPDAWSRHILSVSAPLGLSVFGFWLLIYYFPTQLNDARMRALAAESERRKAELARLRANLHPHFLLNTLNAVAGLLVVEPSQARQLVVALGELLRDSLDDNGELRPLEQELEWLRRYAEIFEIRHPDAIKFEWDLADDTLGAPIPRLLLQPLVENAIEHGVLRRPGGGTITLRSRTVAGQVQIAIDDDGLGMAPKNSSGLGLRLAEERLKLAYPSGKMT
ncbi:MAG TPA: histidine kinase, partial [Polyangiaceae bacterium]|nr:histidine kinase [Polyangiaceae bacterium]